MGAGALLVWMVMYVCMFYVGDYVCVNMCCAFGQNGLITEQYLRLVVHGNYKQ